MKFLGEPAGEGLFPQGLGGGLSPQGGGLSPLGWACCDFENWEWLPQTSGREVWHHLHDILKRLESSDHWAHRSKAFECLSSWLVTRPGEHLAEQATHYLLSVMNLR